MSSDADILAILAELKDIRNELDRLKGFDVPRPSGDFVRITGDDTKFGTLDLVNGAPDTYANRTPNLFFHRSDLLTLYANRITNSMSSTPAATSMNFELTNIAGDGFVTILTLLGNGDAGFGSPLPTARIDIIKGAPDTYANRTAHIAFHRSDLLASYSNRITNSMSSAPADTTMNFELTNGAGSGFVNPLTLLGNGNMGASSSLPTASFSVAEKCAMNADGGFMVKLTNKTGGNSVKGEVVMPYDTANDGVAKIVVDEPDPMGVFYESGVADGAEAWIVVAGIADVYFIGNATRGHIARGFVTGDAGYVTGQVLSEAVPTPPFTNDKHWFEVGHVIQAHTGAGLARCVLHFN